MAKDRQGNALAAGETVVLRGVVVNAGDNENGANCTVLLGEPDVNEHRPAVSLNSGHVARIDDPAAAIS